MSNKASSKLVDRTILVVAVLGSFVLLNIVSVNLFGRLDLTENQQFTLSQATIETLQALEEPVTVRAYFSEDLPPQYASNARYVQDLLDEYYAYSDGMFRYEFIDPQARVNKETESQDEEQTERDIFGRPVRQPTEMERTLRRYGIPPVQVAVFKDDKREIMRAYMGLAILKGEEHESIPVIKDTSGLEYDLTSLVRKLTREQPPKIAWVTGHEGPSADEELSQIWGQLQQLYDVTELDLGDKESVPEDVDALVVAGPKTAFSEAEKRAIDEFVLSGRSAAFLLDSIKADLQTGETEQTQHGLESMLETYGVRIKDGLVLDKNCAPINTVQQRGFMRIQQQVRYPYIPMVENLDPDNKLTRGIPKITFPFASPMELVEVPNVASEVLVRSSDESWVVTSPYNLNPNQRWTLPAGESFDAFPLAVSLNGGIPSHFQTTQPQASGAEPKPKRAQDARILVAGSSAFITDQFMSQPTQALVLNMMDWLVMDEAMLAMRSRGLGAAPLEELESGTKSTVKYGNIFGVPLLFLIFGLFYWQRREKRRREITL